MASEVATRLTADEFWEQYGDAPDTSVELVRGEVVTLPPPGFRHARVVLKAAFWIELWAEQSKAGRTVAGDVGLLTRRDPDTIRGADVAYYSYGRLPPDQEPPGYAIVPPELIVEVTGPTRTWRDAIEKAGEYLGCGVDRVWILDSKHKTLHILRGDDPPVILRGDDLATDEANLPGFSRRVSEFFEP